MAQEKLLELYKVCCYLFIHVCLNTINNKLYNNTAFAFVCTCSITCRDLCCVILNDMAVLGSSLCTVEKKWGYLSLIVFAQWRRNVATSVRLSLRSGEEMGLTQFDCLCAVEKKCGYLSSIFTENYILICLVPFSVLLLWYYLLACQPVDLRAASVRGGKVSSTYSGPRENREWLIVLVPAHPRCPGERFLKWVCYILSHKHKTRKLLWTKKC